MEFGTAGDNLGPKYIFEISDKDSAGQICCRCNLTFLVK